MLEKSATSCKIELKEGKKKKDLKDKEPTTEKISIILKESTDTVQNETQKSIIKKSTKDTEFESLDEKRKELRQKASKTLKYKV